MRLVDALALGAIGFAAWAIPIGLVVARSPYRGAWFVVAGGLAMAALCIGAFYVLVPPEVWRTQ